MSFSENDYPFLLAKMKEFCLRKPYALGEIVAREIFKMLDIAPLYPGIVVGLIDRIMQRSTPDQVRRTDEVVIVTANGQEMRGIVERVEGNRITLRQAQIRSCQDEITVENPEQIWTANVKLFEQEWPSLLPITDKSILTED